MRRTFTTTLLLAAFLALVGFHAQKGSAAAPQTPGASAPNVGFLIVYGDIVIFHGGPNNCILSNRYKRGQYVGFRIFVADPTTGKEEESAQPVVHMNYRGNTIDLPMRYRATEKEPTLQFWVAQWLVPPDAQPGIIRYTVTATDKQGRTGEFKPFDRDESQLTIVE